MLFDSKDPKGQTFNTTTTRGEHYGQHHESNDFTRSASFAAAAYHRSAKFDSMREMQTKTSKLIGGGAGGSGTIFITVRLMITKLKLFLYFVLAISTGGGGGDDRGHGGAAFTRTDQKLAVQFEVKKEPKKAKKLSTRQLLSSEPFTDPGWAIKVMIYLSYGILIGFGYLRNFLAKIGVLRIPLASERNRKVSVVLLLALFGC